MMWSGRGKNWQMFSGTRVSIDRKWGTRGLVLERAHSSSSFVTLITSYASTAKIAGGMGTWSRRSLVAEREAPPIMHAQPLRLAFLPHQPWIVGPHDCLQPPPQH